MLFYYLWKFPCRNTAQELELKENEVHKNHLLPSFRKGNSHFGLSNPMYLLLLSQPHLLALRLACKVIGKNYRLWTLKKGLLKSLILPLSHINGKPSSQMPKWLSQDHTASGSIRTWTMHCKQWTRDVFYKLPNSPAQSANHLNRDPDWTAEPPNAIHSESRHQSYSRTEHPLFVITLSKALS